MGKLRRAQQHPQLVDHGGDVDVLVGVHAEDDPSSTSAGSMVGRVRGWVGCLGHPGHGRSSPARLGDRVAVAGPAGAVRTVTVPCSRQGPYRDTPRRSGGSKHRPDRSHAGDEQPCPGCRRHLPTRPHESAEADNAESVVTAVYTEEGGKTRLTATCVYPSRDVRDAVIKSGMEKGAAISYDRLEEVAMELQRS